ncbi:MAG TPA: sulfatase-like hydrolase/transferase [Thermoanaerobaculia bacterium]|nr:sulfatase-like hydrolase/transferase [Thermoanaerobaculia bacterium]
MKLLRLGPALGALGIVTAACSPAVDPAASGTSAELDMVLLVVDGLRVDRLDALLAAPSLAPLAELLDGDDVLRFDRAYAPSSLAEQSLASLFSGRLPTHGGGIGLVEAQPSPDATTLATRLRRAGYRTGFVSQQPWAARPGFTRGFDGLQVATAGDDARAPIAHVALRVLAEDLAGPSPANAPRAPFLLVAHWAAPDLSRGAAAGRSIEAIASAYDDAMLEKLHDAAALLAGLVGPSGAAEREALSRVVVVLTSSHGFELLEHGDIGSGFTLHEEVVRVPLVVRLPDRDGRAITEPVSTVRLLPTLLELARVEPASGEPTDVTDDRSLLLPSAETPQDPATPVIAELVVRERAIARAVLDGRYKYLQVLRDAPIADRGVIEAGYEELQAGMASGAISTPPLFGDPVAESLLRLGDDLREEQLPLAAHAPLLSRLRAVLRDYARLCESTGFTPPAITERMPIDPNDVRELEALGYM